MSKRTLGWGCALFVAVGFWGTHELTAQEAAPLISAARQIADVSAREINSALDQRLKTPLQFEAEQLDIIIDMIAEEYNLPIVFDEAALDEVAISPETEMSINLRNVSLRSAFKIMLKEPGLEDLCFVVDDEVLLITTQEKANETLEVVVYRVDDLVNATTPRFNSAEQSPDYDSLINVIVTCIEHDSWQENGKGEGEIQPFSPGMLIVSQTHRVQQQVENLLDKLRQAKSQDVNTDVSDAKRPRLVSRGFALVMQQGDKPEEVRKRLSEAIKKSVDWDAAKDSSPENKVWLEVMPDRVLVRHAPEVIKQVAIVLEDMGVFIPAVQPSSSFGRASGGGAF